MQNRPQDFSKALKKQGKKYPYAISNWENNWQDVNSLFQFSGAIRQITYTTYTNKKIMPIFHEIPVNSRALKKSDLRMQTWLFQLFRGIILIGKGGIKMLKDNAQMTLDLSPYQGLYEAIIPQNHILRKLKDNIDFSFVNPMLRKQYCEHFGRPAKEPEMMFKLLFLKKLYDLSDERLISSAKTDMAYKYFLGLSPEDKIIDPSLLTKFRKTRITEDILEDMLKETIQQAIQKGLVKSGTIIVDATHIEAAVRPKSVP